MIVKKIEVFHLPKTTPQFLYKFIFFSSSSGKELYGSPVAILGITRQF